jgi:anti-sigma-K factor RskA
MSICDELEELIPAYVLDALAPSDHSRLERHVRDCPDMRDEIASYQSVAAQLCATAEPALPRIELKYRVIAAVGTKPGDRGRGPFRSTAFLQPLLAMSALVRLIALIGWNVSLQNRLAQQIAVDRQRAADLTSQRDLLSLVANADPTTNRLQGTGTTGNATGRVYAAANDTDIALVLSNMPTLAPDQVYQVWLSDWTNRRISGRVFTVDNAGWGWLVIHAPQILAQYQAAGVTVEPMGGSPQPTGARILFASFAP